MTVQASHPAPKASFFQRHERLTLVLVNLVMFVVLIAVGEIVTRYFTNYSIGYYTDPSTDKAGIRHYPWGDIKVNSLGYADEEFDLATTKPRIGWFGDSVGAGLGAGYPYRITDLVRKNFPDVATWNFGGHFGGEFNGAGIESEAAKFKLNTAVYILNLNDIVPPMAQESATGHSVYYLAEFTRNYLDVLRDKSYLYNWLRTSIKNAMQRVGFEASGYFAYELWPQRSDDVFKSFAARVNDTFHDLRDKGVQMCVVMSPYEMQISDDAARTYTGLGFKWEDGFLDGSTQKKLRAYLDKDLPVYDGRDAFKDKSAKVGEDFVYNEGDKIDWNHPNRKGHALLAQGFINSGVCPSSKTVEK
jgi:hypothetical protein